MKIYANAKVNLALDVVGKRSDGYHDVAMIMQEISLCDILEINLNDSGTITLACDSTETGAEKDNIAYRAAKAFLEGKDFSCGCDMTLEKHIPVCAGLGGGSADAAAVLKGLNFLLDNPYSVYELLELGLSLGADVPFCIIGGTALAEGIGEKMTRLLGIEEKWLALIKPAIDISTGEAYRRMDSFDYPHPDIAKCVEAIKKGDMEALYSNAGNSFEYVTEAGEVSDIKAHLLACGAEFAMMSGSGPTVYGIFDSESGARSAFESYRGSFSGGGVARFVLK